MNVEMIEAIYVIAGIILTIIIGMVSTRKWYYNLKDFIREMNDVLRGVVEFIDEALKALENDKIEKSELEKLQWRAEILKREIVDIIPYLNGVLSVLRKWGKLKGI